MGRLAQTLGRINQHLRRPSSVNAKPVWCTSRSHGENVETIDNPELESQLTREMFSDQLHAQRIAVAWLMAQLCPSEANEWLLKQRTALKGNVKLEEVEVELGLLQDDLQLLVEQSQND